MNISELLMTIYIVYVAIDSATSVPVKQIYATPPTPIVQVKPICPPSMVARQAAIPQLMVKTLNEKGGRFMPSFMAADEATAANFPNLLPLADMDSAEANLLNDTLQFNPLIDNAVTKAKLLEDLNTWSRKQSAQIRNLSTLSKTNSSSTRNQRGAENVQESDFESISSKFELLYKNKPVTKSDVVDFMKSNNISINPIILNQFQLTSAMEETTEDNRVKRSLSVGENGVSTTPQYCHAKGFVTDSGFLRMCTACAATTELQADKFPRYINEVICNENDKTCFTVNGTPHGVCRQSYIHVTLLRSHPDSCRMVIKNGSEIIVGEWEPYTQRIRTGCECFIDKRSLFAPYVGK